MTNLDQLLAATCAIAVEAGELIQKIRQEGFDTASKDDLSPVTRADREADAVLKRQLRDLEPGAAWLSEETADSRERLSANRLWIVDPLDGTKEFMKGLPEYTVAIALVEDGEPVLGVVHNPVTAETFSAARGKGAFRNGQPIEVREGDLLLASRSETARGEFEPFERSWQLKPVGSIEYKLALVAAGEAALTFSRGPKHEWDVCAGAIIVREAGGLASELFGEPLRFNQPFPKVKGILAGAPRAYEEARTQLASVGASDRMDEFKNASS